MFMFFLVTINNLDKIHTTTIEINIIIKNLKLDDFDIINFCKKLLKEKNCKMSKHSNNWYCKTNNTILTINSNSYSMIQVHLI